MTYDLLSFLSHGLLPLPWWGYVALTLVLTHITIASVTIFLHRSQAHRGARPAPGRRRISSASGCGSPPAWSPRSGSRSTASTTRRWRRPTTRTARRRAASRRSSCKAPSSIATESRNRETLDKYGHGTPDDWIERNLYERFSWQGVGLMLAVNLLLFGPIGATIWAIQMMWIPVTAAGIINGARPLLGLPQFRVQRRVDEHRAVGHPDRRRGAAQQPPRLRHVGEAVVALVRVRHRLDVHPHARNARARHGPQGRAAS